MGPADFAESPRGPGVSLGEGGSCFAASILEPRFQNCPTELGQFLLPGLTRGTAARPLRGLVSDDLGEKGQSVSERKMMPDCFLYDITHLSILASLDQSFILRK